MPPKYPNSPLFCFYVQKILISCPPKHLVVEREYYVMYCIFILTGYCSYISYLFIHRPQLLSLDLSNNNLSDLLDVVRKLGTMPKLRNLVLQGNPLSVRIAYFMQMQVKTFYVSNRNVVISMLF